MKNSQNFTCYRKKSSIHIETDDIILRMSCALIELKYFAYECDILFELHFLSPVWFEIQKHIISVADCLNSFELTVLIEL